MIDIINDLKKDFPEIKYTIIGSGDLLDSIKNKIDHLGLNNTINIIDYYPYENLDDLAVEFDLNIGMGYSLLDVGSFGLPSIVAIMNDFQAHTPGFTFDLTEYSVGENIHENKSLYSVFDKIHSFLKMNEKERASIGLQTYSYVHSHFDEENIMNSFINYISHVKIPQKKSLFKPNNKNNRPKLIDFIAVQFRNNMYLPWNIYRKSISYIKSEIKK